MSKDVWINDPQKFLAQFRSRVWLLSFIKSTTRLTFGTLVWRQQTRDDRWMRAISIFFRGCSVCLYLLLTLFSRAQGYWSPGVAMPLYLILTGDSWLDSTNVLYLLRLFSRFTLFAYHQPLKLSYVDYQCYTCYQDVVTAQ